MGITDDELIERASEDLARSTEYYDTMRQEMRETLDFVAGDQWTPESRRIYEQQKRMMLTMDRVSPRIARLVSEQRKSRPSIKIRAVQPDLAGHGNSRMTNVDQDKDYDLSDVLTGMTKAIEAESDAYIAYDMAYEHALQCGIGGWRIITEYDGDSFDQKISILPIHNPLSIVPDPDAKRLQDMRFCIIEMDLSDAEYERRYGENPYKPKATSPWYSPYGNKAVEYYWLEDDKKTIWQLSDGRVIDADPAIRDEMEQAGIFVARERVVEYTRCMWAVLDGNRVLQSPQEIPSRYIPVALVVGRPILDSQGRIAYRGVVYSSMDAQRLYNFSRTTSAETMALQPKAPFIAADEQIEPYANLWATANTELHSYLPYRHVDGVAPPGRASPEVANQAALAEAQLAEDDIDATTGVHRSHLGNFPADASGAALDIRTEESGEASYFYYDNLLTAIKYTGRVIVDMIPRVYDTQRVVTVINSDESEDYIRWRSPIVDRQTGTIHEAPDLQALKYSIDVVTGPYGASRRRKITETLERVLVAAPQLWDVVGDLLFRNLDAPGSEALAERMEKVIRPGLVDGNEAPTPQQIQEMVLQQVQQYGLDIQQYKAVTDRMEAQAKAEIDRLNAQIKTMESAAKAKTAEEKLELERLKAMVDMMQHRMQGIQSADSEVIRDLVAQAIAEYITETQSINQQNEVTQ